MKSVLAIVFALLLSGSAPAQEMGPPRGPRHFERIEQLKKVRLIELLDLKEEQSVRFFARLNEHDKAKQALMEEKNDALDRLERLIRNRGNEADFMKLFAEVRDANRRIAELNESFFDGLTDILSTEQRAKLLLFERHFAKELREAMMEVQRRRMDGPDR